MMTVLTAVLFLAVAVLALYTFGVLSTPYLEGFRIAFYFLLVLLVLIVGIGLMNHPFEGYDPTARTP